MKIAELFPKMPGYDHDAFTKVCVVCADGYTMSVQASRFHYCEPREDRGPYSKFEVGFPDGEEPEFMPYADDPTTPTETVYGWVPAEVIDAVIQRHGGPDLARCGVKEE